MNKLVFVAVLGLTMHTFGQMRDDYVESGRWGFATSITDDGMQFGPAYYSDILEAVISVDSSHVDTKGSTPGTQASGDTGVKYKLGYRWNLQHNTYFSAGMIYYTALGGYDNGVSTSGTYKIGPYVGIQRYFPGTPVMFNVFIQPYAYSHEVTNDGLAPAGQQITNTQHFFQYGGMGLAYLF